MSAICVLPNTTSTVVPCETYECEGSSAPFAIHYAIEEQSRDGADAPTGGDVSDLIAPSTVVCTTCGLTIAVKPAALDEAIDRHQHTLARAWY